MASKILFAWVGNADLDASSLKEGAGDGPIGTLCKKREFTELILLFSYPKDKMKKYSKWLQQETDSKVTFKTVNLPNPSNHEEIYLFATQTVQDVLDDNPKAEISYHISPGTPSMHAVWVLMAKTSWPAELLMTYQDNIIDTNIPFDIFLDYIPSLKKRAAELVSLAQGQVPDDAGWEDIIHKSKEMSTLINKAQHIAGHDVPVIIQGDSGTGKELLAKAIHLASKRRDK